MSKEQAEKRLSELAAEMLFIMTIIDEEKFFYMETYFENYAIEINRFKILEKSKTKE